MGDLEHVDNVTHSLLAVTLSRTSLRRVGAGTTAALFLASNAPDIDIVAAFSDREGAYLAAHRGPTHGPLGIVLLAAVTTGLVRWWSTARGCGETHAPRASLMGLFAVSLLGATLHVVMDLPTSYGTRVLSPFVRTWFAFDWLPIIDPYLLIILAAGLIALRLRPAASRRTTAAVLLAVAAHYGVRAVMHDLAITRAGGDEPVAHLDAWSSSSHAGKLQPCGQQSRADVPTDRGRMSCGVVALPTFLSPFEWRILNRVDGGYEVSEIDLFGRAARREPAFYSTTRGSLIDEALRDPLARAFMEFARLPVAQVVRDGGDDVVVGLQDLRFVRDLGEETTKSRLRPGPFFIFVHVNRRGLSTSE